METNPDFWSLLDQLISSSELIIDRPKGTPHPRYPDFVYPIDYGYLQNTHSMDQGGIDVFRGTEPAQHLDAIFCTVDLSKRDSEIKLLVGCTESEKQIIFHLLNDSSQMKGLLIRRPASQRES